MSENDREELFKDLMRETARSWLAMPLGWRIALLLGLAGFLATAPFDRTAAAPAAFGAVRIASLSLVLAGAVANIRACDEFYQRIYLEASAIGIALGGVVLFGLGEFAVGIGIKAVSVLAFCWILGFVYSFLRFRRA